MATKTTEQVPNMIETFKEFKDTKNKFKNIIMSFFESDNDTEIICLLSFIYSFVMNPCKHHQNIVV